MVDILMRIAAMKGVWRGKAMKRELASLLTTVSLHFEVALPHFNIIPLRQLDPLIGRGRSGEAKLRHIADVQLKEELMQLAARMGAALTASRLNAAFKAFNAAESAEVGPGPGMQPALAVSASESFHCAGRTGASAYFSHLALVPVVKPIVLQQERTYEDYEGMVMQQYLISIQTGFPEGPLHIALDGVQAKATGEINQYFALAPARLKDEQQPVKETTAWLPVQVAVCLVKA